jgi:hypothetical protein
VKAYLCDSGKVSSTYKSCDSRQFCLDGVCEDITVDSCHQTADDNNVSYLILTNNRSVLDTKQDYCFNSQTLIHYTCDGKDYHADYVSCNNQERCTDGKCEYPYVCSESKQRTSTTPGEVVLTDSGNVVSTESDACSDDIHMRQVSCDSGNHIIYALVRCPANTACDSSDGVCR